MFKKWMEEWILESLSSVIVSQFKILKKSKYICLYIYIYIMRKRVLYQWYIIFHPFKKQCGGVVAQQKQTKVGDKGK